MGQCWRLAFSRRSQRRDRRGCRQQCIVQRWREIAAASASCRHAVGLLYDGRVVVVESLSSGACEAGYGCPIASGIALILDLGENFERSEDCVGYQPSCGPSEVSVLSVLVIS